MAIVNINTLPKPVAVALDWHLLPGTTSERKEVDALARQAGSRFGCVISDDEAGLTLVGLSGDKKEGVSCGAAWLARASGGAPIVLVEPLEDGRLWLCAVRAGMPVQGLDMVIDAAHLHERLHDFLRDSGETKLCSTLEHLDQAYPNVSIQSFAELVASTKPERIKRISGVNPALMGVVALGVLVFGGWYGADAYMTKTRQAEAQAKLQELNAAQARQEAEKAAALKRQHQEAGEALLRSVVLEKPAMDTLISAYFSVLEDKPLTTAGWTLAGYDCAQLTCSIQWHRGATGTIVGFLKSAEASGWTTTRIEGNDAVTTHAVVAANRAATLDSLADDTAFRAAVESRLQEASVSSLHYELGQSESLEKQLGGVADQKAGQPAVAALPYKVGTLTVKGTSLFELREVPDFINHPGISVKDMRGDLKTSEWTLELNYATR